jgi:hypothetical protein
VSEERGTPVASGQGSNPAAPNFVPGVPTNFHPVYFQDFSGGVNTLVSRVAIQDKQLAWCDGFIPLGPDSLRTIPDNDPAAIYTAPSDLLIVWYGFQNIQSVVFCIILHNDGSVVAVNVINGLTTPLLPAGTVSFANLNFSSFRTSQWQGIYVLMVNDQPNGYWIWDGTNIYTAGTIGPTVTITDPGRDPALSQMSYIGIPQSDGTIILVASSHPVFDSNGVSKVVIDSVTEDTTIPQGTAIIVGFGPTGGPPLSSAFGIANIENGVITAATISNGGSGYTSVPTTTVVDGTGTGAVVSVNGASGGIITSLEVSFGGHGYSNPSLVFSGGGGSGAAAYLTVENGVIQSTTAWSVGNGYLGNPTINFIGPTGVGATAIPLVVGGQIVSTTMASRGAGYTDLTFYTVSDGNGPAAATVDLMPFGVSGTAIEVYKSRVWISNGRAFINGQPFSGRTLFSAADSVSNFGGDGGAFQASDSFTRIGYTNLLQVNGFLYLIADNSLNYISNIQTNSVGTPPVPIATFSNINTDPMTGSFWPSSVYVYGRNIVMANANGMYLSSGGAVTKVSQALDGIWRTSQQVFNFNDFPGGVVTVYGRNLYCVLIPTLNKITGIVENMFMIWDGQRCFTSHQTLNVQFVASYNYGSYSYMYGTDQHSIHRLFNTLSATLTKSVMSKLYSTPSYWTNKVGNELHALFTINFPGTGINITIDNENGTGNSNANVLIQPPTAAGYLVIGPQPIGQQGRLMGLTIITSTADIEINSVMIQERIETLNI